MGASPEAVTARAWCRVDLAGGTLDIWPLGQLHPGARTINLAVDLAAEVRLERRREGYLVSQGHSRHETPSAIELKAHADTALVGLAVELLALPPCAVSLECAAPRGGGLGGSSALAVALLVAGARLVDRPVSSPASMARLARDLEARLMSLPTGLQDHYPALLGGALEIRYRAGGERVRPLAVDLEALRASLLIVYTGHSHFSAGTNWQIIRRRLDGEAEATHHLSSICDVARRLGSALEAGDLQGVGKLMHEEWRHRRQLADGIDTPEIHHLLERSAAHGAWGGKACGAGGGGCVALLCPPERRVEIEAELVRAGGNIVPTHPTSAGVEVVVNGVDETTETVG